MDCDKRNFFNATKRCTLQPDIRCVRVDHGTALWFKKIPSFFHLGEVLWMHHHYGHDVALCVGAYDDVLPVALEVGLVTTGKGRPPDVRLEGLCPERSTMPLEVTIGVRF